MDSERYERALAQVNGYIEYQRRRGRRPETLRTNRNALTATLRFLYLKGLECEAESIGEDEIVTIVTEYDAAESSVHYYIRTLKLMLRYYGNGIIDEMGLLWNADAGRNVKWITRSDFDRLLDRADPTDRIIITLAAYAGMRRGEIAELRQTDILSDRIVITGKGHGRGKQRIIPKTVRVAAEVERYLGFRRRYVDDGQVQELVVAFAPGKEPRGMNADAISKRVQRLTRSAGIDATPHSFRRLFATEVWGAMPEKDMRILQRLLGHTNINTTAGYVEVTMPELAQAMDRL